MDWVIGLCLFSAIATLATVGWLATRKIQYNGGRVDIRPIALWFKMVATIFWFTFFGLLGLHFWVGG